MTRLLMGLLLLGSLLLGIAHPAQAQRRYYRRLPAHRPYYGRPRYYGANTALAITTRRHTGPMAAATTTGRGPTTGGPARPY